MYTRRKYYDILDDIFATGGLTEKMKDTLDKLKLDFDEREEMLKRYGETYDGEDGRDEYDYNGLDIDDIRNRMNQLADENKTIVDKYDNLNREYVNRFWGTDRVKEKTADILREQAEDIKRDGTEQTFETLFKRKED